MDRPYAVLKLDKRALHVIAFAQHVVQSLTNNPAFPSPSPPLPSVQADIDALAASQALVLSRAHGAAKARDGHLASVVWDLQRLRSYVQAVANRADAELGAQLIASAGLSIKKRGVHPKQRAAAVPGPVSGSVRLTAPFAGKRASYSWRYAQESGAFSPLATTVQARTRIESLTPGRAYSFQVRALTPTGSGDWSEPVVFLAL